MGKIKGRKLFVKGTEVLTYNSVVTLKKSDNKVLLRRFRDSTNIDMLGPL